MHIAYEFFKKEWNDTKHEIHCNAVVGVCIGAIQNTNLHPDIFQIAGWIHDMGKLRNKENHHIESLFYLQKFLSENPKFADLRVTIEDCILNHRTNGNPKTVEGELFKVADKVALQNLDWIKYKKSI